MPTTAMGLRGHGRDSNPRTFRSTVFKTAAINRSAAPPGERAYPRCADRRALCDQWPLQRKASFEEPEGHEPSLNRRPVSLRSMPQVRRCRLSRPCPPRMAAADHLRTVHPRGGGSLDNSAPNVSSGRLTADHADWFRRESADRRARRGPRAVPLSRRAADRPPAAQPSCAAGPGLSR